MLKWRYVRFISLLLSIIFVNAANAQHGFLLKNLEDTIPSYWIKTRLINESSATPARFVNTFLRGPKLTDEAKNKILENTNPSNRLGMVGSVDINIPIGSLNSSKFKNLKLEFNTIYGASYSKNLLDIVLNGNAKFDNQTVYLGSHKIEHWRYASIGYERKIVSSKGLTSWGANINLISNYQKLSIESASLLTSSDSNLLRASFNGEFQGVYQTPNFIKGYGIGLNFSKSIFKPRSTFKFTVSNLGFATIAAPSVITRDNYEYSFTGFDVTNLIASSNINTPTLPNPIDSLNLQKKTTQIVLNPFSAEAVYQYRLKDDVKIGAGIDYLHMAGYAPKASVLISKKILRIDLSGILSYGGFSNLSYGIGTKYVNRKTSIGLAFNALGGFLIPNTIPNSSIVFNYTYRAR